MTENMKKNAPPEGGAGERLKREPEPEGKEAGAEAAPRPDDEETAATIGRDAASTEETGKASRAGIAHTAPQMNEAMTRAGAEPARRRPEKNR